MAKASHKSNKKKSSNVGGGEVATETASTSILFLCAIGAVLLVLWAVLVLDSVDEVPSPISTVKKTSNPQTGHDFSATRRARAEAEMEAGNEAAAASDYSERSFLSIF